MPARLLGAHIPSQGGLGNSVRFGHEMGCGAIQVFTSSPRQWYSKPVSEGQVSDFKAAVEQTGLKDVVSHDSYLVNLAAPTPDIADKSFDALRDEMVRCGRYGIDRVVSHLASYKGQDQGETLVRTADAVRRILEDTPESVTLLMETTAGMGSSINSRFEEMFMLLDMLQGHPRLCVCLDTCHVFAAGYPIHTEEGYEETFAEFDRLVGLSRLRAIHCNDSKKPFGSRLDRHENIGKGQIGPLAFRKLVNDPRFENTPILLETEADSHQENLDLLKGMREGGE